MYVNILDQNLDFTELDTILDSNLDLAAAAMHLHQLLQGCNPRLLEVFALKVCFIVHSLLQSLSLIMIAREPFWISF